MRRRELLGGGRRYARLLAIMAIVPLVVAALVSTAGADHPPGEGHPGHCPDHQDAPKDDDPEAGGVSSLEVDGTTVWLHYSDDLETVEFFADEEGTDPLAVDFCVKASNQNSGEHTGTSFTVDWTTGGGQTPEISYVVVYAIADGNGCPGEDGSITLTPESDTNPVNSDHTVTATVTDAGDNACEDAEVRFEVTGDGNPNPEEESGTTDGDGEADFSFTNDTEGENTITACVKEDGSAFAEGETCDDADHSATATKTWEVGEPPVCPGEDGSITLTPESDTNPVNSDHTVTATVTDAGDNACEDAEVRFEVTGDGNPNPEEESGTTDGDGEADFSFTNDTEGENTITACVKEDGSAFAEGETCDDADLSATATKTWTIDDGVTPFCRANVLAAALAGNPLPNLFEANPPSEPCVAEQDGLLVALSPLLGDGGAGLLNDENQIELRDPSGTQPGFIIVDALWADTDTDENSTFASADSGVLLLQVNDRTDDQIIVEVLTSESHTSCEGEETTTTSAEVVRLFLGGEEVHIPGEHTVLIDPALFEVIELHLEDAGDDGADEGPDATGAQAADLAALAGNLTAAVADSETGCG